MTKDTIACPKCSGSGRIPDQGVLGARFAAKRKAADVSQKEVAAALHVSQAIISYLEAGRIEWSETTKRDYEKALQRKPATRRKSA